MEYIEKYKVFETKKKYQPNKDFCMERGHYPPPKIYPKSYKSCPKVSKILFH